MDWNDLRYLLALHRRGSLAKAAVELGVTKATVSRRIDALETSLGVALALRDASGLTLTAAGVEAVRASEQMDLHAVALERALLGARDDKVVGVVRVTAPPWLAERMLIPGLARLRQRFPGLEVRVLGSHALLDLASREADVALRNVVPSGGPLVCRRVGELAGCVYGAEGYLARRGVPDSREALSTHDLLGYEGMGGMPGFGWFRESPWSERVVFRAGDPSGLAVAVAAEIGLAAIPCLLGETSSGLRRVESLGVGYSPLYLVTHEDLAPTARVRAVTQFIVEALRANEAILLGRSPAGGERVDGDVE